MLPSIDSAAVCVGSEGYQKASPSIVSAAPGRCRVKRALHANYIRWCCGLPLVAGELGERDIAELIVGLLDHRPGSQEADAVKDRVPLDIECLLSLPLFRVLFCFSAKGGEGGSQCI